MYKFFLCFAALVLLTAAVSGQQHSHPKILMVATGGTIAGEGLSSTSSSYVPGVTSVERMLQNVPGINELATIRGEQFCNVGSQDMTFELLLSLANYLNQELKKNDVDGIVITHGTDTMEETAFFLNLTLNSSKPVVLVGAMRPSSALGTDGPLNLYNAVATAASAQSIGRGVLVVMNDLIFNAQSVVKMNTSSVQAFQSPVTGAAGMVSYGRVEFFGDACPEQYMSANLLLDEKVQLPRVDIIYACTAMSADLIDASVQLGAKGLVIAGVGNGNMSVSALKACADAVRQGVVVVRSSRVATGAVGRNVEINDDELGFIVSNHLNPAKSRVLLTLLLTGSYTPCKCRNSFLKINSILFFRL